MSLYDHRAYFEVKYKKLNFMGILDPPDLNKNLLLFNHISINKMSFERIIFHLNPLNGRYNLYPPPPFIHCRKAKEEKSPFKGP